MDGLNIDGTPGDLIKKELLKIAKIQLGSENYELSIEPGSKKGRNLLNYRYTTFVLCTIL